MADQDSDEVEQVVRGLLTIARIAMPRDLFAIDPRVIKAQALLSKLRGPLASGRVPAIARAENYDISPDELAEIDALMRRTPEEQRQELARLLAEEKAQTENEMDRRSRHGRRPPRPQRSKS